MNDHGPDLDLAPLRDHNPPEPDDRDYEAVQARARTLRTRRWSMRGGAAALLAIVVAAAAVGISGMRDEGESIRTTRSAANTTPTTPLPIRPEMRCFPHGFPSHIPTASRDVAVSGWPRGLPPLLVLEGNGDLWVIDGGRARAWSTGRSGGPAASGYLWAQFAPDGTIYATRLVDTTEIDLEHLTKPDHVAGTQTLPFTVKPDAPAGYCPIDGYLATFSIGPEGLVLINHQAGPVAHHCPYIPKTTPTSEWTCQSPEAVTFEIRSTPFAPLGTQTGVGFGGYVTIVGDSTHAAAFAVEGEGVDRTVTVVRPNGTPECCYGGQKGTAFALSPEGSRIAFSSDGRHLDLAGLTRAQDAGQTLWTAPNRIDGLAWSGTWIVVAHGGNLTLVSAINGDAFNLDGFAPGATTTLDWAS
jgi:hypothetical protein